MGAKPWSHFTPYQTDINAALQSLKEQEFRAGRYGFEYWHRNIQAILGTQDLVSNAAYGDDLYDANPSPDELIEQYGDVQAAMDALLNQSSDVGTMSILDMISISEEPGPCAVCPLSEDEMQEIFQTKRPSREMIEAILLSEDEIEGCEGSWEMFWESINRGEGRYIVIYENGQPTELWFAGYSFD